jgi:hypothetical protein
LELLVTPSEEPHIYYQTYSCHEAMNNNTVLAIAFLIAGTLLTTTALTTMVPAAYADNKQKADDESAAATADCDDNDVERAGFDCFAIALNDIEVDTGPPPK